eukprot:1193134-Amphidinium_carterae.1
MDSLRRARVMLPVLSDVHADSVHNWWKPAGGRKGGRRQKAEHGSSLIVLLAKWRLLVSISKTSLR